MNCFVTLKFFLAFVFALFFPFTISKVQAAAYRAEAGIGYQSFSPLGNYNPPMKGITSYYGVDADTQIGRLNATVGVDGFYQTVDGSAADETGTTSGSVVSKGILARIGVSLLGWRGIKFNPYIGLAQTLSGEENLSYLDRPSKFSVSLTDVFLGTRVAYTFFKVFSVGLAYEGFAGVQKMPVSSDSFVGFNATLFSQVTVWGK